MTIPLKENYMINTNTRKAVEQNMQDKKNRWNGYDICIIKDSQDALEQLDKVILQRQIKRNMFLNNGWRG